MSGEAECLIGGGGAPARLVSAVERHYRASRQNACCDECLWESEMWALDREVWAAAGIVRPLGASHKAEEAS